MKFIFLFSLLFFISCGNDKLVSNRSQSSSGVGESSGILSIPAPGIVGGGPTLALDNSILQMGTLSQQASSYLDALYSGQINLAPLSRDNHSTKYRVHFSGTPSQGPCPFNPMAQCSVINLESLSAY